MVGASDCGEGMVTDTMRGREDFDVDLLAVVRIHVDVEEGTVGGISPAVLDDSAAWDGEALDDAVEDLAVPDRGGFGHVEFDSTTGALDFAILDGHAADSGVGADAIFAEVDHVVFGDFDATDGIGPLDAVAESFCKITFVIFGKEVIAEAGFTDDGAVFD